MKPNSLYIVTFEIHRNCQVQEWYYYCQAKNAKEASEIAKRTWTHEWHMFHVHAVKSRVQDANLLLVSTWKGNTYKGQDAIGKHIMISFRTWRINGRNLYA